MTSREQTRDAVRILPRGGTHVKLQGPELCFAPPGPCERWGLHMDLIYA
jgi:hypothetical protein